jgi:3-hydroxybutyryl-CoA dehydratase
VFFQNSNEYKFDGLTVGQEVQFPEYSKREGIVITEEMQRTFQKLTGNVQPVHIETPLVYGMLIASFYSTLAGVFLPGKFALCHSMDLTFNKPVYIGDSLIVHGKITEINESVRQITVKARIINQRNEVVSKCILGIGLTE